MATVGSLDLDDPNDLALFIILILIAFFVAIALLAGIYFLFCRDRRSYARRRYHDGRRGGWWMDGFRGSRRDYKSYDRRRSWSPERSRRSGHERSSYWSDHPSTLFKQSGMQHQHVTLPPSFATTPSNFYQPYSMGYM